MKKTTESLERTRQEREEAESRVEERRTEMIEEDGEVVKTTRVTTVTQEEEDDLDMGCPTKRLVESFHAGSEIQVRQKYKIIIFGFFSGTA